MNELKLPSFLILLADIDLLDRLAGVSLEELELLLLHNALVFDLLMLYEVA